VLIFVWAAWVLVSLSMIAIGDAYAVPNVAIMIAPPIYKILQYFSLTYVLGKIIGSKSPWWRHMLLSILLYFAVPLLLKVGPYLPIPPIAPVRFAAHVVLAACLIKIALNPSPLAIVFISIALYALLFSMAEAIELLSGADVKMRAAVELLSNFTMQV